MCACCDERVAGATRLLQLLCRVLLDLDAIAACVMTSPDLAAVAEMINEVL
jgi:hypothetical protein